MVRLIKRYRGGSRKLYDTEESRYVSLEEIAQWIRQGQELRIVDSKTDEDVTAQTLAQVIYEEERRGVSLLPSDLLHEVIRRGEEAFQAGVERLQHRVDRFVKSSVDRVKPLQDARTEMEELRARLDELEASLRQIEGGTGSGDSDGKTRGAPATRPSRRA